MKKFKTL